MTVWPFRSSIFERCHQHPQIVINFKSPTLRFHQNYDVTNITVNSQIQNNHWKFKMIFPSQLRFPSCVSKLCFWVNNYIRINWILVQNQRIEKMIWLSLLMIDLYLILWPTGFFLRFPHLFMGSTTLDSRRKSFYVNGNIRLVRHESFYVTYIIWYVYHMIWG